MSTLRNAYVASVRTARRAADRTGLIARMSASSSPRIKHLRSLFAIHNVSDLAELDVPWWSYPAIARVEEFLGQRSRARVFEFGAGASTLWLGRRAGEVHSVEHDTEFLGHVEKLLAECGKGLPVTLYGVSPSPATERTTVHSGRTGHEDLDFAEYVGSIDRIGGDFDIVVVDGRARVDAFERALEHLAPGGLIIFDNVRRKRYAPVLGRPGLRYELLRGATPALPYPTTTGLIWRD